MLQIEYALVKRIHKRRQSIKFFFFFAFQSTQRRMIVSYASKSTLIRVQSICTDNQPNWSRSGGVIDIVSGV